MNKTNTKTLIVTETVRYEFEGPASMPEDETTLKRFFGRQRDPWIGAEFAAVTERDFVVPPSGRVPSFLRERKQGNEGVGEDGFLRGRGYKRREQKFLELDLR